MFYCRPVLITNLFVSTDYALRLSVAFSKENFALLFLASHDVNAIAKKTARALPFGFTPQGGLMISRLYEHSC